MFKLAQLWLCGVGRGWVLVVAGAGLACGTVGAPRGAEAVAGAGPFAGGPEAPVHGLALPSLDVAWSPPQVTAGDLAELAGVLSAQDELVLALPAGWLAAPLSGLSVADGMLALAPDARWHAPRLGTIAHAAGVGPLQLAVRDAGAGPHPRYVSRGARIDPGWATELASGADAVVLVGPAPISVEAWRALPVRAVGGCDALHGALAAGQEHGLAEVEPFVEHLDALLLQVYRSSVAALVPAWIEELSTYVAEPGPDDPRRVCAQAYLAHVRTVAACGEEGTMEGAMDCTRAPRVYLRGGLWIGLPPAADPPPPSACASLVGRDYVAASERLAVEAAEAIEGVADRRWLQLADRVGALTEIHAALTEICTPRRRRISESDIATARDRMARIGDALASELVPRRLGRFVAPDGSAGALAPPARVGDAAGGVRTLAYYDGGVASVATKAIADTQALVQWLRTRARCRGEQGAVPWVVLTADASGGAPLLLTYVYPEQLTCDGLPPQ